MKRHVLQLFVALLATHAAAFELASPQRTATLFVPAGEPECVRLAAADLASDAQKITGHAPTFAPNEEAASVVLASLNRPESAALLEKIAPGFGDGLKGKWEAYRVETIGGRLIIAGSDERGTMFGLYAFIEKYLGVDPLYYWAGRPPAKRPTLAWDSVKLSAGEPSFKFRGWFINDEDLLTEFRSGGGERRLDYKFYHQVVAPEVSARIYEAALRLQMNLIIPASFVDIRNPAEARLVEDAARRGLLVTMHHVEPLGVSAFAFDNYWKDRGENVPFAITQHPEKFREIWRDYAQRWAKFGPQVVWQLGLRGIADRPVWLADPNVPKSDEGRGKLISDAMATQWEIIRSVDKRPQPLATTTLWMEGAALHAGGHLKFPAGMSVVFSDNSPGWEMQDDFYNVKREPGRDYGIYYHQQLWNVGPHLVQGVSVWRTHKIFKEAVRKGSTNYAMLNVSNIREFVLGIDASARLLRDFPSFDPGKYLTAWCEQHFGSEAAAAEAVYRQHFATFLASHATNTRAMLDGEWMTAGVKLAKALAVRLEKGGKSDGKTKDLLRKLRPELEAQRGVDSSAKALLERLDGEAKTFFENNLVAQHNIMLGLLRWVEHVAEADRALDAGDAAEVTRHIQATKEGLALIDAGKALASRGEFKDWYRGDRKMNCAQLGELTAKLEASLPRLAALPAVKDRKPVLDDFPLLGKLATRSALEIKSSSWSVGGETLDRDFAIYANYKQYLGPLGAKGLRVQTGWAKCEKQPGVYDFAWLDEVVNDARAQGVQPWLEVSYGNPIYPEGGGTGLGAGLPKSPEALRGWDAWVKAIVLHFKDRVPEWEVWNEPNGGHGITAEAFAEFYLRTAVIIRTAQPQARLYAFGLAGAPVPFAETLLKLAKARGQLGLIDAITYHGYPHNPDATRDVEAMRALVARYSDKIEVRQGETGAPSGKTVGALSKHEWSELTQAKWDLRRMLAYHGKDVPFNLFTLCELKYAQKGMSGMNRKGLLQCNDDMTVARPKLAYYAAQRVFAIFDDTLVRVRDFKGTVSEYEQLAAYGYRKQDGAALVAAVWLSGAPPTESKLVTPLDLTLAPAQFTAPVLADLLTGEVREIPRDRWSAADGKVTFKQLPLYDAPVLIAEKAMLKF
jgi:hypothetical protein